MALQGAAQRESGHLHPGSLVSITHIDTCDAGASQLSRPSSSGSSDREILIRQRRGRLGVFKVIRTGSVLRDREKVRQRQDDDPDPTPEEEAQAADHGIGEKRKRGKSGATRSGEAEELGDEVGSQEDDAATVAVCATQSVEDVQARARAVMKESMSPERERLLGPMVAYIFQVANYEVAWRWRELMSQWRLEGTLLMARHDGQAITAGEESVTLKSRDWLAKIPDWDREFVALYDRAKRTRVARALQDPQERLQMADLGLRYLHLQGDAKVTNARPQRVVAKEEMYVWIHGAVQRKGAQWNEFARDIKYWKRWLTVTTVLHRGVVALFPDNIKKSFIEQQLHVPELSLWLETICRFRPELREISASILPLITDALAGLGPPQQRTRLEAWDGTPRGFRDLGATWFEADTAVPRTPPPSADEAGLDETGWEEWLDFQDGFSSDIQFSTP